MEPKSEKKKDNKKQESKQKAQKRAWDTSPVTAIFPPKGNFAAEKAAGSTPTANL